MKTSFQTVTNKNIFYKITILSALCFLVSSCGNSKSNPTTNSSNSLSFGTSKVLATCNKTKDANLSISSSLVTDQSGQISSDWIKIKFNFLSTDMMASGNTIRFFKWKISGTQSYLDNTPLSYALYDLSSGQSIGSTTTASATSQLNSAQGLYINLNDPNAAYQVLKVVVYNSSGQIVAQMDSLIPGFYASPADYQYNYDGSPRSTTLQQLHNLYSVQTTGWSSTQYKQYFDQYCF